MYLSKATLLHALARCACSVNMQTGIIDWRYHEIPTSDRQFRRSLHRACNRRLIDVITTIS